MEFITKTELGSKLGLGMVSLDSLLKDIQEDPITIGKRFYYDYHSVQEKIKQISNKQNKEPKHFSREEMEINSLKKEIQRKIGKNERKLKALLNELDGVEKSIETYIDPRRKRLQQCIEDFGAKKVSQNAYINFSELVYDSSLFGRIGAIFDEHIEDGDYDKKVDFTYNNRTYKVIIIVRDGILVKIKKNVNFADNKA